MFGSFELEDFCATSPATLSEVATLAFCNRGGEVELFFSFLQLRLLPPFKFAILDRSPPLNELRIPKFNPTSLPPLPLMIGDIDPFFADLLYPDSTTFEHRMPQVSGRCQLRGHRSTNQGGPSSRTSCSPTKPSSSKKSGVRERIIGLYYFVIYFGNGAVELEEEQGNETTTVVDSRDSTSGPILRVQIMVLLSNIIIIFQQRLLVMLLNLQSSLDKADCI
ncbi:hypothetical protein C1H46_012115 [Malus baccata]|uniref:Uncharacterized protein n=1 Tax=Malus baccata TaxID=106549 RepID=A0A540MTX3_MALBA|nr:hypothetical protein C1H46_012115 [Malus baccata]